MNDTPPVDPLLTMEALILEWELWKSRAAYAQQKERALRAKIIGHLFPDPKEGSNNIDLPFNYHGDVDPMFNTIPQHCTLKLTLKHQIDRKVDEAMLDHVRKAPELAGVNFDDLIRRKPELATTPYRALTEEQHRIFDTCLVIKPGSPQLEFKVKPTEV